MEGYGFPSNKTSFCLMNIGFDRMLWRTGTFLGVNWVIFSDDLTAEFGVVPFYSIEIILILIQLLSENLERRGWIILLINPH